MRVLTSQGIGIMKIIRQRHILEHTWDICLCLANSTLVIPRLLENVISCEISPFTRSSFPLSSPPTASFRRSRVGTKNSDINCSTCIPPTLEQRGFIARLRECLHTFHEQGEKMQVHFDLGNCSTTLKRGEDKILVTQFLKVS